MPGGVPKWSDEQHTTALRLFHLGYMHKEIGKRVGKSRHAVSWWCKVNGLRRYTRWPKNQHDTAMKLFNEGVHYKIIGNRIGKSLSAVRWWAKVNGLSRYNKRKGVVK